MNVYKLSADETTYRKINAETYQRETNRDAPYYQTVDGKTQCFAVCPSCNNPILLVGMYAKTPTERLYGMHYQCPVPEIGIFDHDAYDWCPYATDKKRSDEARPKREHGTKLTNEILDRTVKYFDRIIFLLEKDLGISFGGKLVENMLDQYKSEQGWLYRRSNLMNIPWVFAYMCDNQGLLFNGSAIKDAKMIESIRKATNAIQINSSGHMNKSGPGYIELNFYFNYHNQTITDNSLEESMKFILTFKHSEKNRGKASEIFSKEIVFNHDYFHSLIEYKSWRPNTCSQRWLELAQKILPAS
jgi:hypothetical protein